MKAVKRWIKSWLPREPRKPDLFPWYDSGWLSRYTRAKLILKQKNPQALQHFEASFQILKTRPDFKTTFFNQIFDEAPLQEARRLIAQLRSKDLNSNEWGNFGRLIFHDHPFFNDLQRRVLPLVSEAVGEEVEPAYNFLSLYSRTGICEVHRDAPEAKWTLDLCLEQSAPWPIYFSQVQDWPEPKPEYWTDEDWAKKIKESPENHFTRFELRPGEAVLFSGSSQWHYREAIPQGDGPSFCHLIFFHFIPKGTAALVRPKEWPRLFGVPELREAL